jgi:glycerate kinase
MALVINDRVKETSTTTGTGAFTLDGAQTGFDTFALGIGGSNTTYYAIVNVGASPSEWEVGLGTLDAGGTVLTRTTVITSSNSDSVVTFTSGTKDVFCTLPASKAVYLDSTGTPVGAASAGFAVAMAIAL